MALPPFSPQIFNHDFGLCITPQDILLPSYNQTPSYYRPWIWRMPENINTAGSKIIHNKDHFKIILDIEQFQPDDISVKVTDKEIKIEAKHEERQDEYGFVMRHFLRRYALPPDCPAEKITSSMSSDGVLTVIALKLTDSQKVKIVPIQKCGATSTLYGRCKIVEQGCKEEEKLKIKENNKIGTIEEIKEKDTVETKDVTKVEVASKEKYDVKDTKFAVTEIVKSAEQKGTAIEKEGKIKSDEKEKLKLKIAEETKKEVKEVNKEISVTHTENRNKADVILVKDEKEKQTQEDEELHKRMSQIMLKEDMRIIQPELIGQVTPRNTEQLLAESRKVTDELMKMTQSFESGIASKSSKSSEQREEYSISKETTIMRDTISETNVAQAATASTSISMASNIATGMSSEQISAIISAELRDAADNK